MTNTNWYKDDATARRFIERPVVAPPPVIINDTTSAVVVGAQALGFSTQLVGANPNRVYLLIQNNTTVNISIAVGNGPSSQGIILTPGTTPGGNYEREIYCFISAVYVTLLAASAAGDFITVEEGSSVRST